MRKLSSILDTDDQVQQNVDLRAQIELIKKLKAQSAKDYGKLNMNRDPQSDYAYDILGNKVYVGDIVVTNGSFATSIIKPLLVTHISYIKDKKYSSLDVKVYDPYFDKTDSVGLSTIMKIFNPEKYLKH